MNILQGISKGAMHKERIQDREENKIPISDAERGTMACKEREIKMLGLL